MIAAVRGYDCHHREVMDVLSRNARLTIWIVVAIVVVGIIVLVVTTAGGGGGGGGGGGY
jgi:TRAP-type uncharacterized transport system fused permease subunit